MINHEHKYIELGHGDIVVGQSWSGLTFQNIRPPQECGAHCWRGQEGIDFLGEIVVVECSTISQLSTFSKALSEIEAGNTDSMTFSGWTIKFIPGSKVSVGVVRLHFDWMRDRMLQTLAC